VNNQRKSGRVWLWIVGTAITITIVIYGRSLTLPFYSDDLVQIPWLRSLRFADLWSQASPYGYYRPLAFSLWLLLRDAGLQWTPVGLRLLNLGFHTIAASLVGGLAWEMQTGNGGDATSPPAPLRTGEAGKTYAKTQETKFAGAVGATGFFAAYPFAYQAVPWVSAIFYPLSITLMVLAVFAYLRARKMHSIAWMVVSIVAAMSAPFAHENGALTGMLVLLAEGVVWWRARGREDHPRFSPWPLAHLAIGGIFLNLWFALRPGGITTLDFSLAGLLQNASILTTGVSFPMVWLAEVGKISGTGQVAVIWGLAVGCIGLLAWLTRDQPEIGLFNVGWMLILSGPVLITMRPDWLIDAPRFLVPAGVGAAVWWGIGQANVPRRWNASPVLAAPLLIAAMLPGLVFAWGGVSWHLHGGAAIWDAIHTAEANPNESLLLVNLPDRLAPQDSIFPFFEDGAILLPPQVPPESIISAHTGTARHDQAVTVGIILAPVDFLHTAYGPLVEPAALREEIASGKRVLIADTSADSNIRLREVGQAITAYQAPSQAVAHFGDTLILWEAYTAQTGDLLTLTLIWEISSPQGTPTIFVHAIDVSGAVIAQADGDPLGGLFPLYGGDDRIVVRDVRTIRLPAGASSVVRVGVWDPATGDRLPATGGNFVNDEIPVGAP